MRLVKRIISTLLFLVAALTVFGFVLENQYPLRLTLFGWRAPELPVSLAIILALLLGMIVGPLAAMVVGARRRRTSEHRHGVKDA
ncbi:lipopolysaccharide assembly protein LapA domain-containing protein [Pseudomonas prosekii]|uniref:DUF1049 domain-containing protein n=1 Tax=Pseudomonas prosekii TaxID=1148509 RepID=A0A2U2DDH7_9PSED|nr:lipopolysaccharide assembly protein LapA domain-containing protein [Pseudomonas prosekii]PWE47442.1 DUF1049 domain-containing protein [Pseudomonas prosekii]